MILETSFRNPFQLVFILIFGISITWSQIIPSGAQIRACHILPEKLGPFKSRTLPLNLQQNHSESPTYYKSNFLQTFSSTMKSTKWLIVGLGWWFGILGVHRVHPSNKPFHKRTLGIQTTNPNQQLTIRIPLAD